MAVPISERIGNKEEFYRQMLEAFANNLRVSAPGIIQSFDPATQTATVQVAIREKVRDNDLTEKWMEIPLLLDVPVMMPRAGGFVMTFPVQKGDECLVVFSDMCIDAWFSSSGVQNQMERRRHDLSDGIAILGLWSQPNKLGNFSTTDAQLRTVDGTAHISLGSGKIEMAASQIKVNDAQMEGSGRVDGSLALYPKDSSESNSAYNFAVITGARGGIEYTELWILVNARYDYTTKRFKRINVNNFSFGWQLQGGGTYPGEENFGDYTNQGVNLWKSNGKLAYSEGDPMRDLTGEDIGALQPDGSWKEFGIMLGWTNVFMCDSYGGMTIGGAGFEVDGNGISPYKRVSLGKFSGGSADASKGYKDYGFAYNGTLWNSFHGLFSSDQTSRNSFYWGMRSPIDFYESGSLNESSNQAAMEGTHWVWSMLPKNKSANAENWVDILSISDTGEAYLLGNTVPSVLTVNADIVNGTDFNLVYPDNTWTKDNTFIMAVKGVLSDGTVKQFGAINATFTDYGIYGYLGSGFVSAKIMISKH